MAQHVTSGPEDSRQSIDFQRMAEDGSTAFTKSRRCLGVEVYFFRRLLLLSVCILGVVQYGMVLVFGVTARDLEEYYGLTTGQVDGLYSWLNFGTCALSFIPGICYDHLGLVKSMALGSILGIMPLLLQIFWTWTFPSWLSTVQGLNGCYLLFGVSSSFYNVIGCFAPLVAFEEKDIGKVSAVVQVCLSLGITIQSAMYSLFKSTFSDFINAYLIYVLCFTASCGMLMCIAFQSCREILTLSSSRSDSTVPGSNEELSMFGSSSLLACRCVVVGRTPSAVRGLLQFVRRDALTYDFLFMSALFLFSVGFSFSFLDVESRISAEVGVSDSDLSYIFGVLNAIGRILVSVPLDYTRHHCFGGVFTYAATALMVFTCGMLCLVLPKVPGVTAMYTGNALVALGYGGVMGIIPPALRLRFGTENLGLIYGLLYLWVSLSVPLWGHLADKPSNCSGIACYRKYCLAGALGLTATMLASLAMLAASAKKYRWHLGKELVRS